MGEVYLAGEKSMPIFHKLWWKEAPTLFMRLAKLSPKHTGIPMHDHTHIHTHNVHTKHTALHLSKEC